MPVKRVKPTTPGRRQMSIDTFSDVTKKKPEKSLVTSLKKRSGRNDQGRITVRHKGGGAKRKYRLVDFKILKEGSAKVLEIEYDPNRSARIALIEQEDGTKNYIIAPVGVKKGSIVKFGEKAPNKTGNRKKLKNIPVGTIIHNIEINPGKGGQLARSAGNSAQIVGKEDKFIHVKLPSGEIRKIDQEASASIGVVSNPEHSTIKIGKAGRSRHMGIRPSVRGKAMNPVDHPHGGGEGAQDIGIKHPKTPWGAPALGYKTRKKKKISSKMIIKGRKKKK